MIIAARNAPKQANDNFHFISADLSQSAGTQKIVTEVLQKFGRLDILVNNLGGSDAQGGGFSVLNDEVWEKAVHTNLLAPVRLDRGFLPNMLERGNGVIIHIASIQARLPLHDPTFPYAAAKAGLLNYSKNLSNEFSIKGGRVLNVSPGWIQTDNATGMMREISERTGISLEQAIQQVMNRLGIIRHGNTRTDRGDCAGRCILSSCRIGQHPAG